MLGPWAKDELGLERPLLKRHGFWVLAAGALLYFPALGLFSLWDPWETHYGEVAREILARDDWISLWWAQDGWFWSKPILNFWMQSIAMATLGTHYKPDQMLLDSSGMPTLHPEWVVRAPNVLFTLLGMYILYKGIAKVYGRRAGLFTGVILATMPDWFFLAHQTMTDMPFVAAMTAAMGLLLLGVHTDDHKVARVYEVKAWKTTWRLSAWHLVFGAILVTALPQILYLCSRNLELVLTGSGPHGFRPHWDEFHSGSYGNCGLPGNEACTLSNPASIPQGRPPGHPDGFGPSMTRFFGAFEPVIQALLWSVLLGFLLYLNWGERRVRRLFYIGAWFFAAVATMAKGPGGRRHPGGRRRSRTICTKRRWSELLRLEIVSGRRSSWVALVAPVVRGDVRASRIAVHRSAHLPRHVQPRLQPRARHERRRRHRHPLLRLAARLRALPVDGDRAALGLIVLAASGATRPRRGRPMRRSFSSCGSSSRSRSSPSWGRNSTTTSCRRCLPWRCSWESCSTRCSRGTPPTRDGRRARSYLVGTFAGLPAARRTGSRGCLPGSLFGTKRPRRRTASIAARRVFMALAGQSRWSSRRSPSICEPQAPRPIASPNAAASRRSTRRASARATSG